MRLMRLRSLCLRNCVVDRVVNHWILSDSLCVPTLRLLLNIFNSVFKCRWHIYNQMANYYSVCPNTRRFPNVRLFCAVMLPRAETLLHDHYGQKIYWEARRSMMYAKHLKEIGDQFRKEFLESNDIDDKTQFNDDWTKEEKKHGDAIGGPYIGVHLRRKDFKTAHKEFVPSLKTAASQVRKLLSKYKLKKVFLATDAPPEEIEKFKKYVKDYEVYNYVPSKEVKQKYKDGGISIIDQWICAHARYFVGTHSSTFSFRIHEDREILGFKPETTFNRLCTKKELETKCEDESKWKITYKEGWYGGN